MSFVRPIFEDITFVFGKKNCRDQIRSIFISFEKMVIFDRFDQLLKWFGVKMVI